MTHLNLENKKILVTGSSRGIGAGLAQYFSKLGAKVAVTYGRSKEQAEAVFSELEGNGHQLLALNLNDFKATGDSLGQLIKNWDGEIHGLVNNAGISRDQLLMRLKEEELLEVLNTNLASSIWCTKQVLKPMMKQRLGSVVNISSVIGHMGNAGQVAYAASKGGLEAFTKSLAKELGSRNIRVNSVAPGFIKTDMTQDLSESQKEELLKNQPLNRLGEVTDVAQAAAFLLSENSSYITGQCLHVNGGLYM